MKIVILNGSPRKNGDTTKMLNVFTKEASKNHDVKVFDVAHMDIAGCKGCEYCHKKSDGICIQHDDMDKMYDNLRETEVLILASPIYYYSLSGQLQTALNRTYCIGRFQNLKKIGMILSSHDKDAFGSAIKQLEYMLDIFGVENAGIVTSCKEEHGTEEKLNEVRGLATCL